LADGLATPRERLTCLRSYLAGSSGTTVPGWMDAAWAVRRQATKLLRKRHVRAVRSCPQPFGKQGILWLDGDAQCVSQQSWEELAGRTRGGLRLASGPETVATRKRATLPGGQEAMLVQARRSQPLRWLWAEFRGRPLVSAEVRQAGVLFGAWRHGQDVPR